MTLFARGGSLYSCNELLSRTLGAGVRVRVFCEKVRGGVLGCGVELCRVQGRCSWAVLVVGHTSDGILTHLGQAWSPAAPTTTVVVGL